MQKKPKVFAVVVNYNGRQVLNRCLHSLFTCGYENLEVIVVDNASSDGSLEAARTLFSKAHFIAGKKNRGFGGGNNLGVSFALSQGAKYIFLLNNDAWIEKGTLDVLISIQHRNNNLLLLSPLILTPSGNPWFCGGKIDFWHMRALHTPCDAGTSKQDHLYETEYISGCAMFTHRSFFMKVGLFDEQFFLYYEDADLSVRARSAGFVPSVATAARAWHSEESSTHNKGKTYWLVLSGILFFRKHDRFPWRLWHALYLFLRKCKNGIRRIKNPNDTLAKHVSKAYKQAGCFRHHRQLSKRR